MVKDLITMINTVFKEQTMNKIIPSSSAIILACSLLFPHSALYAKGQGDSDIILADLSQKDGHFVISNAVNITDRAGYDNQPHFSTDGKSLFYTAQLPAKELAEQSKEVIQQQTDSMKYNLATGTVTNETNTNLSEYSPTINTDQNKITVVQVEHDNRQRLWQFSLTDKSTPAQVLLKEIEPVGYFAFGANQDLLMFVLGEPHTLQYIASLTSKPAIVDNNIGRSVKRIPDSPLFSYIKVNESNKESGHMAMQFDPKSQQTSLLVELPTSSEYFGWHPQQYLLTANGNQLLSWNYKDSNKDWTEIKGTAACDGQITRIAVSEQGDKIAFVCQW